MSAGTTSAEAYETVRQLVAAKCCIGHKDFFGGSVLHHACINDDARPEVIRVLIGAAADVNYQQEPSTFAYRSLLKVARLAVHAGSKSALLQAMASWQGWTPLMPAAQSGQVDVVRELIAAKADPSIRNRQGHTAYDLTRLSFGEGVPASLKNLLITPDNASYCDVALHVTSGSLEP